MRIVRSRRITFWACASLLTVGGCHDPRFIKQTELRKNRIENHLANYHEYDAGGPKRMKRTADTFKALQAKHKKSLASTTALVKKMHQRDVDRWRSQRDLRRERTRTHLRGKPEQINDTWGRMVY